MRRFLPWLLALPEIWRWIKWGLGWGEHIEFVSHNAPAAWRAIGAIVDTILNPPPLTSFVLFLCALAIFAYIKIQDWRGRPIIPAHIGTWVRTLRETLSPEVERRPPSRINPTPPPAPQGITTVATATVSEAPYYTRDDIDQMLTAMRRISVLINQTAVDARDSVQELMIQWPHILDKKGKAEFMVEMDRSQEKVDAVINETWAIVKEYRHYHDEIGPILNGANFSGLYHQTVADFRNAVSVLPGDSGYGTTLHLIMPQSAAFANAARALQDWMTVAFDRLEATTKRLRSLPHSKAH